MKKSRIAALTLSAAMFAGLLAGCGSSGSDNRSAGSSDQVTLRFSWWGGDERHEATLAVIDAYEKQHPDVKIEAEYSSYDGYAEKKTTEFASKTAPDIFQIETGLGPEYQKQGVLYNISDTDFDFSKFDENFLTENGQFGTGKQYALPTGQAGTALVVNKTLADEIGIDFSKPYDWEQFFVWGKKVREYDPECYLLSANTSYATAFIIRTWCRQFNGKAIIDDEMNLNMTEAQFKECFEFIKRLYDEGVVAPASYKAPFGDQDQQDPNWIAGKYVAAIGYTSSADVLAAANPDVEYLAGQLPLMKNGASDGWFNDTPQYIGIYANSKNVEAAADFLDFFYNSAEAAKILGTVRSVPPTEFAQEICTEEGSLNPLTKEAVEVSMQYNGKTDGGPTTGSEVKAILNDAYENVSYGTMTPDEAASKVVSLLNDYISTNK